MKHAQSEGSMKNNPNKATIDEMAGLYQNTVLPLLIETDIFLKSLYANGYEIRSCYSYNLPRRASEERGT